LGRIRGKKGGKEKTGGSLLMVKAVELDRKAEGNPVLVPKLIGKG